MKMKTSRVPEPEKNNQFKGALEICAGIVIAIIIFLLNDYLKALEGWGYVGVFIVSLLSAATIFIPAPGWAIVFSMAGVLNPVFVGIVAGIGSGIGEITAYAIGKGAKDATDIEQRFGKWREWIRKNDLLAVAALAFIPNPAFDVAGMLAGALGIPVWRFLAACIIGRILRYVLLAYLGAFSVQYL